MHYQEGRVVREWGMRGGSVGVCVWGGAVLGALSEVSGRRCSRELSF